MIFVWKSPNDFASNILESLIDCIDSPFLPSDKRTKGNVNNVFVVCFGFLKPVEKINIFLLQVFHKGFRFFVNCTDELNIWRQRLRWFEPEETVAGPDVVVSCLPELHLIVIGLCHYGIHSTSDHCATDTDHTAAGGGTLHVWHLETPFLVEEERSGRVYDTWDVQIFGCNDGWIGHMISHNDIDIIAMG